MLVFFIGYLSVTGIMDLTNKKDLITIKADAAVKVLEVEHSINGLIPMGKDHYYAAVDEKGEMYLLKASKSWYKKNFDPATYEARGDVTVTALNKRIDDYEIREEIEDRIAKMEGITRGQDAGYCIMLDYKINAIIKLAVVISALILTIMVIYIKKKNGEVGKGFMTFVVITAFIFGICILMVIE